MERDEAQSEAKHDVMQEGRTAYRCGYSIRECPYLPGTRQETWWKRGWRDEKQGVAPLR